MEVIAIISIILASLGIIGSIAEWIGTGKCQIFDYLCYLATSICFLISLH